MCQQILFLGPPATARVNLAKGSLFRFLILFSLLGSLFGFHIQIPYYIHYLGFLIWVPYLYSLLHLLSRFYIWVYLLGFLIQVPSLDASNDADICQIPFSGLLCYSKSHHIRLRFCPGRRMGHE